jgi:hypothetical protein
LHKPKRSDICQQYLGRYGNGRDTFTERIATGDERRIHHSEPEGKWQIMDWTHPQGPTKEKFQSQPSAGQMMLTFPCDSHGPVLEHHQERGTTIYSVRYHHHHHYHHHHWHDSPL